MISHLMNIFKTTFLCLLLHFVLVFFLVASDFAIDLQSFSIGVAIILCLSGLYAGYKDIRFSEIDAIIAALLTCSAILMFISQYEALNQKTNLYLYISYVGVLYVTSFIGAMIHKGKEKMGQTK